MSNYVVNIVKTSLIIGIIIGVALFLWHQKTYLLVFITPIVTFLAVITAFIINWFYDRYVEKKKARRLLLLLKDEIRTNLSLLRELNAYLRKVPPTTPFFGLKFVVWNAITPVLIPTLEEEDFQLIKDISKFYYELQHIERKLKKFFDLSFHPDISQKDTVAGIMVVRQAFLDSLNEHIPKVLMGESCKNPRIIIIEIEHLIDKLNSRKILF